MRKCKICNGDVDIVTEGYCLVTYESDNYIVYQNHSVKDYKTVFTAHLQCLYSLGLNLSDVDCNGDLPDGTLY